ncbi:MAG TPA: two-component regulator propeller domain-containing protein [Rubricoccaceae bacterium]|nr:two-component regulator propeller domain-containing protein [Rubricoccaceae bacterium]
MRYVLRIVCLAAAFGWGGGVDAQPAALRFEVPEPGTLSNRPTVAYALVQDRAGFLWIATEEGLYRYDGVTFERFRADPDDPGALPGDRITGLAHAPDGALWAAVDRFGLVRFDPRRSRFERVRLPASFAFQPTLAVDGQGKVWIGTGSGAGSASALLRYDPASRRLGRVPFSEGPGGWGFVTDADGAVWAAHRGGLLYLPPGQRAVRMPPDRGSLLGLDARGTLWRLYPSQRPRFLQRFDRAARRFVTVLDLRTVPGLGERARSGLLVDRRGVLWMRESEEPVLLAVDPATRRVVRYRHDPSDPLSFPSGSVSRMIEDREGVLWVATTSGLRKVVPRWEAFEAHPLPPTDLGHLVAAGPSGHVYTGSLCGALFRFGGVSGQLKPLAETFPALEAARPRCLSNAFETRDGSLWLAGWPRHDVGGLVRLAPSGRTARFTHDGRDSTSIASSALRVVLEDGGGRLWVGTEDGLDRLDPATGRFTHYRHEPGNPRSLSASTIWSLAETGDGRLWVGTYGGGLNRFDPATGRAERFVHDDTDPTSISADVVTVIHRSRAEPGVVWVGTYGGGLNRFKPSTGHFARFTRRDGMPGLTIKSILEDRHGDLWVGTEAGLVRFTPATGDLRVYTEADGLPGSEFGLYDAAALPDGRFAFAAGGHLVVFHPDSLGAARFEAPVVLRSLRVLGRARPLPPVGTPLRLAPDENVFSVDVAALAFAAPARVRYAYRLDPLDEAWVPMGSERTASFAHLPPGRYLLRVRAGTASGAWSPNELTVPVIVVPPWWATWWFRALVVLVVLAAVALGVRALVRRRYRARIRRLEVARRLQAERARISRDLHDHVGAQVANLLAGVELARLAGRGGAMPAGDGSAPLTTGSAPEDPLAAVEADARATLAQLRETIWALRHEAVACEDFRARVEAYVRDRLRGRTQPAATIAVEGDAACTLSPMQALHLYRIAQEAVSNALKYANADQLAVTLRVDDGTVALEVRDDGAFKPPAASDGLSGFGLDSMRRRAEELGGHFALDTGAGTAVRVVVPREAPVNIPSAGD